MNDQDKESKLLLRLAKESVDNKQHRAGMACVPSTIVGMTKLTHWSDPDGGNSGKVTLRTMMSRRPSQKVGIDCPATARNRAKRATQLVRRTEATIPSGIANEIGRAHV